MKASSILLSLFALLLLAVMTGCASSDTKNASARPWSSPRTWENGLPAGITEGR